MPIVIPTVTPRTATEGLYARDRRKEFALCRETWVAHAERCDICSVDVKSETVNEGKQLACVRGRRLVEVMANRAAALENALARTAAGKKDFP
jgi:hypothetical protein